MKVINGIANFVAPGTPVALTLGFFDGVHLGHQCLLAELVRIAAAAAAEPVVLTFDSHPFRIVRPERLPPMIMTLTERITLMEQIGIRTVVVQPFDELMSNMPADDFLHQFLLAKLKASIIVCGYDTHFGRNREGNHAFLEQHAAHDGFSLHNIPPLSIDDMRVSSTAVRQALQHGDFARAEMLLGKPWTILAQVVEGSGVARSMGFPTANLDVGYLVLPHHGIYAGYVHMHGTRYRGVIYVGTRPTFPGRESALACEVYVVDFSGNVYDEWLRVQPVCLLRPDRKFPSKEDLTAQIAHDVQQACSILEKTHDHRSSIPRDPDQDR